MIPDGACPNCSTEVAWAIHNDGYCPVAAALREAGIEGCAEGLRVRLDDLIAAMPWHARLAHRVWAAWYRRIGSGGGAR